LEISLYGLATVFSSTSGKHSANKRTLSLIKLMRKTIEKHETKFTFPFHRFRCLVQMSIAVGDQSRALLTRAHTMMKKKMDFQSIRNSFASRSKVTDKGLATI
jgi:hypothetical protein